LEALAKKQRALLVEIQEVGYALLVFAHHMRRPWIHVTKLLYPFGATVLKLSAVQCEVRGRGLEAVSVICALREIHLFGQSVSYSDIQLGC